METRKFLSVLSFAFAMFATLLTVRPAAAQKVFLNCSDQTTNAVAGGGNEAQYALIDMNLARDMLVASGFTLKVSQDFTNSPANANSWGADIFISIHTNAGGGHGTETLYKTTGGKTLADHIQKGLLSKLPYQNRGLKYRDNLHMLNATNMYACLLEAVFHDCSTASGVSGHPPSEAAFLKTADGQQKIAGGIAAGVCSYYNKTCGTAPTQKGFLKGVVYKAPDLASLLPGAKVTVTGGPSATYADTPWSFELDPGTYTVTATLAGYAPASVTRDVVAGKETWGSIGLQPTVEPPADASTPDSSGRDSAPTADVVVTQDAAAAKDAALDAAKEAGPKGVAWEDPSADSGCACAAAVGSSNSSYPSWTLIACMGLALTRLRRRK
jgi:hypothetical protein